MSRRPRVLLPWARSASVLSGPSSAWPSLAVQALLAAGTLWLVWQVVVEWALLQAVFQPDAQACRDLEHRGACWGVVAEKWRSWLFGRYPLDAQWRPAVALLGWALALLCLLAPLWRPRADLAAGKTIPRRHGPAARVIAALVLWALGIGLLSGGWGGLPHVEPVLWSGLPLTVLLTSVSLVSSLPLALLLAWGRLSPRAWLSWPSAAVVEVVRGAPLVMWLFLAAFVLPAALPASWDVGPVARVLVVTTLFSAAYAAEILRGALHVVAAEQDEAARVLGAGWWTVQFTVIVPQALRTALPPLTSHAIGLLKDTALVMIVSLQDLTGAMSISLNGDPEWRPFFLEAYLVIALAYALMCLGVAAVGRRLEARYPGLGRQQ